MSDLGVHDGLVDVSSLESLDFLLTFDPVQRLMRSVRGESSVVAVEKYLNTVGHFLNV